MKAEDADGHLPLYYSLIPASSATKASSAVSNGDTANNEGGTGSDEILVWRDRAQVISALTSAAQEESRNFLSRVDLTFDKDNMPQTKG